MENLARLRRFERPTPAFGGQYSIHLSYRRVGENYYCGEMSFYNKAAATSASDGSDLFCRGRKRKKACRIPFFCICVYEKRLFFVPYIIDYIP